MTCHEGTGTDPSSHLSLLFSRSEFVKFQDPLIGVVFDCCLGVAVQIKWERTVFIGNTADFCDGYSSDQRSFSPAIAVPARETALFIDE